jgi:hypothetical protein
MNNQLCRVKRRAIIHRSVHTRSTFKVGESKMNKMTFDPLSADHCRLPSSAIFLTSLFFTRTDQNVTGCHHTNLVSQLPTFNPPSLQYKSNNHNGEAYSRSSNQKYFQYLQLHVQNREPKRQSTGINLPPDKSLQIFTLFV